MKPSIIAVVLSVAATMMSMPSHADDPRKDAGDSHRIDSGMQAVSNDDIFSALLDHLYGSVSGASYSRSDLRHLLTTTLISGNADLNRFMKILKGYGSDSLNRILAGMDLAAAGISHPDQLIESILKSYPSLENDFDDALMQSAANL